MELEEDIKILLKTIINNQEKLELFFKGWKEFENNLLKNQSPQVIETEIAENNEGDNMKGITIRKDGRYMIRKTINGNTITKYAKTKQEAMHILTLIKKGKIKIPKTKREKEKKIYTIEEYSSFWLETYKKPFLNYKSFSAVKGFITRINKELGKLKLNELTTKQIQSFLNAIERSRAKEKICIYFKSMLQKAVDTGILKYNPFNAVIKDKKVICKNTAYNYAEQQVILNIIKDSDIEHEILTYLMCGCRPNELPQKKNFDFENKIITINGTKNTNALHREIEMSNEFANYMKEYFKSKEMQEEKYVSKKFIELCLQANINKPLLYRLRHTFATNHFTLGTQPKIVQHWLGHGSISITLDTYTDIDKTANKEKIKDLYNNFYYIP